MTEGVLGYLGGAVMVLVVLHGIATVNTDPPSTAASRSAAACAGIAAIGCTALSGFDAALANPDAYARSHP